MLKRALASVYAQTVLPSCIHLVVDEPEDNKKYEFLEDYDSTLRVIYTGGGFGGAKARNIGLDQVGDVEFVFFLDDDDEWLPNKIEKQIGRLRAQEKYIAMTCWNYEIGGAVTEVRREKEEDLNENLKVWNTVGSFSFFGYRLNAQTRSLRLWSDLEASQDWEFYLRLSKAGIIGIVEEYLVNYSLHDGPRISGNAGVKASALEMVYQRHRDRLSIRQRHLQKARIHMFKAEKNEMIRSTFFHFLAAVLLALSGMSRIYSMIVIKRALSALLNSLGIRQYSKLASL